VKMRENVCIAVIQAFSLLNPIFGRSKVTVIWAGGVDSTPPIISESSEPNLTLGVLKCLLGPKLFISTFCFGGADQWRVQG